MHWCLAEVQTHSGVSELGFQCTLTLVHSWTISSEELSRNFEKDLVKVIK